MLRVLGGALTARARSLALATAGAATRRDAQKIEEHVWIGEKQRPEAQFEEVPLALQIPGPRRGDEQRAAQAAGVFRRGTCAALHRGLHDHRRLGQRGEHAVAQVERPQRGVTFELERRNEGAPFGDQFVVQLLVLGAG